MANLSDVANLAGVSLATASRAFNGSRTRSVRPQLRERVFAAAQDLGYVPNAAAQAMVRGHTNTVSLVVHDISDPFFSSIAAGVIDAAARQGLIVTLATTQRDLAPTKRDVSTQLAVIEVLRSQRPRALILAGGLRDNAADLDALAAALADFRQSTGATVTIIGQDRLGTRTVTLPNAAGAGSLADALIAEGHRTFGVLRGPIDHLTAVARHDGFVDTVTRSGGRILHDIDGVFSRDGAYDSMCELLTKAGKDLPDVIFAVTDVMALGAMAAARAAGLRIPTDVGFAGFDDINTLRDVTPGLSTVRVPLAGAGQRAVELALSVAPDQRVVEVSTEVVLRGSTARC